MLETVFKMDDSNEKVKGVELYLKEKYKSLLDEFGKTNCSRKNAVKKSLTPSEDQSSNSGNQNGPAKICVPVLIFGDSTNETDDQAAEYEVFRLITSIIRDPNCKQVGLEDANAVLRKEPAIRNISAALCVWFRDGIMCSWSYGHYKMLMTLLRSLHHFLRNKKSGIRAMALDLIEHLRELVVGVSGVINVNDACQETCRRLDFAIREKCVRLIDCARNEYYSDLHPQIHHWLCDSYAKVIKSSEIKLGALWGSTTGLIAMGRQMAEQYVKVEDIESVYRVVEQYLDDEKQTVGTLAELWFTLGHLKDIISSDADVY